MTAAFRTDKNGFPVEQCGRCVGRGNLAGYSHVFNGVCFGCNGSGWIWPKGKVRDLAQTWTAELRAARQCCLATFVTFTADGSEYDDGVAPGDTVREHGDAEWRTVATVKPTRRMVGWGSLSDRLHHCVLETVVTFTDGSTATGTQVMWQRRLDDRIVARRADLVAQAVAAYTATLARRAKRKAA